MSYRIDLTERLIEIPFRLSRRAHSRQELAREYGVNAKTISHDIDALTREYPVIAERAGREIRYRLDENFKFEFPILSPEELAVLLLSQEAIAGVGLTAEGSPYGKYADSLLEKVRKSLPHSIKMRMEALAKVYGSSVIPAKNFARYTKTIDTLASCAVRNEKVEILYRSLNKNEEKKRLVAPYAVYFDPEGATLKLIALESSYGEIRVFSIDRILSAVPTGEKFTRPLDFSLQGYLEENCFNGIHGSPITIRLRAAGITARIFAERKFHPSQKIVHKKQFRAAAPETVTIEMRVANGRGLIRFILSYLPDVEVLSPPELREQVREVLQKSLDVNFGREEITRKTI